MAEVKAGKQVLCVQCEVASVKESILSAALLADAGWALRVTSSGAELRKGAVCLPLERERSQYHFKGRVNLVEATAIAPIESSCPAVTPEQRAEEARQAELEIRGALRPEGTTEEVPLERQEVAPPASSVPVPSEPSLEVRRQHELTH